LSLGHGESLLPSEAIDSPYVVSYSQAMGPVSATLSLALGVGYRWLNDRLTNRPACGTLGGISKEVEAGALARRIRSTIAARL
jgi:hypothetical protein